MFFRRLHFNISLALRSIRTNRLRAGITMGIIALGIMSLVGILTAIEGLKSSLYNNFSSMGANTFTITSESISKNIRGVQRTERKDITYREAMQFKHRFLFRGKTSVSGIGTQSGIVKYLQEESYPNVMVMGIDDYYLDVTGASLKTGRNMTNAEVFSGSYVCILGYGLAKRLFQTNFSSIINETVSIGNIKYRIIGVTESRGGNMSSNADNTIYISLENARNIFSNLGLVINVFIEDVVQSDLAATEAEGLFRAIRRLPLESENNFRIRKNDQLVEMLKENIAYVSGAAMFIGFITLIGAAIGLMNIMLVSVTERTREIGINKALGAKNSTIREQFLTEAIIISICGGLAGIVFGILMGNIVSLVLNSGFVVPWAWIVFGLSICTLVGILAGIYPAKRAAKLDPIQALRHE